MSTMMRRAPNGRLVMPFCLALLLAGLVLPAPAVHAATTLHVTSCADNGGAATLRGRIGAAQAGDRIVFDQDCTITLTTGTLTLTHNVTIDGTGHTVRVDGGCTGCDPGGTPTGGVTVFAVPSGVTASLTGLTIQNGHASVQCTGISGETEPCGGGISNSGTLTLTNSTVTDNSAVDGLGGGMYSGGTLTLRNSTISDNSAIKGVNGVAGGGIMIFSGTATLTDCTISGNSAPESGAVHVNYQSTVTVTGCTLPSNFAEFGGGAIVVTGKTNTDGTVTRGALTVANSTIFGNSTGLYGGGIFNVQGLLTVKNCTIDGNSAFDGGGINNFDTHNNDTIGTVRITNTIVAENAGGIGPDVDGPLASGGHNLFGSNVGSDIFVSDPLLGPLGNNGGPTQTMPLLPGSLAITQGDLTTCTNDPVSRRDQRGQVRLVNGTCDIGAYEAVPLITSISPSAGVIAGGNAVTIQGYGLAGPIVTIGGVAAAVTNATATSVTVIAPAHAAGAVDVTVTVNGRAGTKTGGYIYAAVNALPPPLPTGGSGGSPAPLPGGRAPGGAQGAPNPLPVARP